MSKRAIILAGGKGTRLRPYTVDIPKPLVPINDKPILEIIIRQLIHNGFSHITMAVNHLAELIVAFCGKGERWGITLDYSFEEKPLGTMGPLKLIKDLPDDFLVMNGDILTDLNYNDFFYKHTSKSNLFTVSSYNRIQYVDYGVLIHQKGILNDFKEKPVIPFEVSMGIYMINKRILKYIPDNLPFGFDQLMLELIRNDEKVNIVKHTGYWLDIGRPDDYEKAQEDIKLILHE